MLRLIFPPKVRQWIGPLAAVGAAGVLLAILVIASGFVDLSARLPHPQGWARVLHFTFQRSTAFHSRGVEPPADLDSPVRITAGAAYYGQVCAHCHSGPGLGQNPVVLMMHPRPQYLATDLAGPTRYTPAELFRIVDAGVKYSAMPGWPAEGRPDEVWQIVAFLRAMPKMTPDQFRALALRRPTIPAEGATDRDFGPPGPGQRYAMLNDNEPPVSDQNYRWPVLAFGADNMARDPLQTCAVCHGADGRGGGAFPNLTLQDKSYIRRTLIAFANGSRESGFMRMVASQLSPRQIEALADYYSSRPRVATETGGPVDPVGRKLVLEGEPSIGLGPCAGCHGVTQAAAKAFPVLEGQSAWYVANQLRVFRAGGRGGLDTLNPMTKIARDLTEAQIEAIARYYASQPPTRQQDFAGVKIAG